MRCLKTHTNMLMRSRQAWGLNTLFFDLCTAPFVLILEEDWMYMDEALVEQTPWRKRAIARAIAATEAASAQGIKAFDGRPIMGAFLRPETYDSFLQAPHVSSWQSVAVPAEAVGASEAGGSEIVEFRTYCADVSGASGYLWGSCKLVFCAWKVVFPPQLFLTLPAAFLSLPSRMTCTMHLQIRMARVSTPCQH